MLPVVYTIAGQWWADRQLLAALGVEDPDGFDTILRGADDPELAAPPVAAEPPADRAREARRAEVLAFLAAAGGEGG